MSDSRILELELEVKRLRDALGMAEVALGQAANELGDVDPPAKYLRAHQTSVRKTLFSTPPPALASAYVRLRDAAKLSMSEFPAGYFAIGAASPGEKLEIEALAEVERLEKGE